LSLRQYPSNSEQEPATPHLSDHIVRYANVRHYGLQV
jgi:hypothetical protein